MKPNLLDVLMTDYKGTCDRCGGAIHEYRIAMQLVSIREDGAYVFRPLRPVRCCKCWATFGTITILHQHQLWRFRSGGESAHWN